MNERRRHSSSSQRQRRLAHTSRGRRPPTDRSRGRVTRRPFDRRARVPQSGQWRARSSAVTRCTTGPSVSSATPTHGQAVKAQQPRRIVCHVRSSSVVIILLRQQHDLRELRASISQGPQWNPVRRSNPHQFRRAPKPDCHTSRGKRHRPSAGHGVENACGPDRRGRRPGPQTKSVVVKGGRLRGEGLCRASAERSSPQAIGEARGHCPLHDHALYNHSVPAGIPASAGQARELPSRLGGNARREVTTHLPRITAVRMHQAPRGRRLTRPCSRGLCLFMASGAGTRGAGH